MSTYRLAALALATCTASLSVAGCTAGITTAGPPTTSPAASSRGASVAASSPSPASAASTVAVGGSIGRFPVPAGAKIAETFTINKDITIFFSLITPAHVSDFYAAALPRAGYVVTGNLLLSQGGGPETLVEFTGHGYKGEIASLANFNQPGVNISGLGHRNVTTIEFMPQ